MRKRGLIMAISDQEMDQIIKKFIAKNTSDKEEKKSKKEKEEKRLERKKEKQEVFVYNDPQKDNLEARYNQTNYQPSLLQVQRDQLVHTSNAVFNSIFSNIVGVFRLLLSIPWKWVIVVIAVIAIIINLETILTYGLILLVGGIMLYSFLN